MVIRPATADDVEAVRGVVRGAYEKYVQRIGREPAPMTADYERLVADGHVWVADDDGAVAGIIVLVAESDGLLLENVAVAPGHQGRGIGGRLIAFAEEHARWLGLAEVRLYTNARMVENLELYPALGYVEVDRRHDGGFDRVFFTKQIVPRD